MRALELRVPPPLAALLIGAAMWFAAHSGSSPQLAFWQRVAAFIGIALGGGVIALAGSVEFRRARTTVNPLRPERATALVTSGIYRFTRNPMYVGLVLVLVGWAVFLGSFWTLVGPIAFVLYISRFQIVPEERALSIKFGAAYAEYKARVRRWL